jgi:DNA-directed RNA polymerase specialized sigma24 family protein
VLARTAGPATRALAAEEALRVEQVFRALAPEHRRVLALRQFEGLSAAECALRMKKSESAVHSLYRRALLAWEAGVSGGTRERSP